MVESQCAAVQSYNLLPVAVRTTLHQHNVCSRVGIIVKVSQNVWKMRYCPLRVVERDEEKWFSRAVSGVSQFTVITSADICPRESGFSSYIYLFIYLYNHRIYIYFKIQWKSPCPRYVPLASISKKYWHCYKIFYLENAIFLPEYFLGM